MFIWQQDGKADEEKRVSWQPKETIYNSEYACLTYPLPDTSPLTNMEVSYWYGSKEPFMIGGMKRLKTMLPRMKAVCLGDYGHGEVMLLHPEQYINTLLNELND